MITEENCGKWLYDFAGELFPIGRSLTGKGVRKTFELIQREVPEFQMKSIPCGETVFDWTVPDEWDLEEAYIEDEQGNRIIDYAKNNLHVVGYSVPVDEWCSREELLTHIHVEENQPDAIPYITSYYSPRYGFCMSKNQRDALPEGKYHMVIKSRNFAGVLNYGELLIPGKSEKEVLLSTYCCHPSMANNETSGMALMTGLAKWLLALPERELSYRLVIVPETIGSIAYISRNLEVMKKNVIAGFVLTCVGDNRTYSYLSSRKGGTLADRVLTKVLQEVAPDYKNYSYLDRGSDERQYNAPGVDLPVCDFCRSKYGEYPEYHTSEDDMTVVSEEGFAGSFRVMTRVIKTLEKNGYYKVNCLCEPQLGKRGLYPTVSRKGIYEEVKKITNLIAYCDGTMDLVEISEFIHVPLEECLEILQKLTDSGLVSRV